MPISAMPIRIASSDAAGSAEERLDAAEEVEVVVEELAVGGVGNPSLNSRVPIRVSTWSGVMILAGIGVLNPSGFTVALIGVVPPRGSDQWPARSVSAGRRTGACRKCPGGCAVITRSIRRDRGRPP